VNRDGLVASLPSSLTEPLTKLWESRLQSIGLGGLSAASDIAIGSSRDILDKRDIFQAVESRSGKMRWQVIQACTGELDYGRGPRATPLILEDRVILLGAFGHLHCVQRATGLTIWKKDLVKEFEAPLPTWGFSGTPLVVDDLVIVQVGSRTANVVAFELETGKERWRSGNQEIAYSSFVHCSPHGKAQVVGYDQKSVGGWALESGQRLWTITPENSGDFNVPTPIVRDDMLWLITENNGLRRHRFVDGIPQTEPEAIKPDLRPDSHTPILIGDRIYVSYEGLHALDATTLETLWSNDEDHLMGYASLIGSEERLLVLTQSGSLTLFDVTKAKPQQLGTLSLGTDIDFQSHPAICDGKLFVRVGKSLVCYELPQLS
jgi:outer membrane protein assembly factor BamB